MLFRSNWPLVVDLHTGAFAGGGGEIAVLNAASAQLSNWLGLPSGVAASLAAGLAGGNLIYESSGMTASLLGASFETFVLDDEMHSNTYRTLRGIEVSEENLGFDAISTAVLGDGHFLGGAHTLAAMERDYFYPSLANRDDPKTWEEKALPVRVSTIGLRLWSTPSWSSSHFRLRREFCIFRPRL